MMDECDMLLVVGSGFRYSEFYPREGQARALLCSDTGTSVFWYARHIRAQSGHLAAHSGGLASMGAAMPYAIAAKFAHPSRPAVVMVGDGVMQMSGLSEMITLANTGAAGRTRAS